MANYRRTSGNQKQTPAEAAREQREIWEALIYQYSDVKENYAARRDDIEADIARHENRLSVLNRQYREADTHIAFYRRKIADAEKLRKAQEDYANGNMPKAGPRSETNLQKAQRLQREFAELVQSAGFSLDDMIGLEKLAAASNLNQDKNTPEGPE